MKKVLLLLSLCLSLNSFSMTNLLSELEANSIVQYLDDICADTFCGGDINYYVGELECHDSSCTISMYAHEFDMTNDLFDHLYRSPEKFGKITTSGQYRVLLEMLDRDEDDLDVVIFSCEISNIKTLGNTLNEKTEAIYDHLVFNCLDLFESQI